jgi:uncharacterized protein (DUF697 family)
MATRKSKTIRANPLDAISAGSIEKVKEPIKKPKRVSKNKEQSPVSVDTSVDNVVENINEKLINEKSSVIEKNVDEVGENAVPAENKEETSPADSIDCPLSDETFTHETEQQLNKKCAEDIFFQELGIEKDTNKNTQSVIPDLPVEAFVEIGNAEAPQIIKSWAKWSALGSMVPAPLVDALLISAAQIKMIHALCKSYGVPFEQKVAVVVVSGLAGGGLTSAAAHLLRRSAFKSVPYLGAVFTIAVEPALSYASSYAIGMTFARHFESEGTLADFNAKEMKGYCSEQLKRCELYIKERKTSIFSTKVAN